ncbi:MAG: hypothetical protein L0Z62_19500 [Gemmataceae bacterium]|nr:hypothetical protein [Gemmataceae bacterium]
MLSTRPQVVAELRALFREGNTPSRLIKHIVACHPGEQHLFSLIQQYFREAFAVPLVRVTNRPEDYASDDLRFAHLNVHLIHQIIQHRHEWDTPAEPGPGGEPGWLDALVATDEVELIQQAEPANLAEFSPSWDQLDPQVQKYIKRLFGNVNALYEKVLILARLAERLQQRAADQAEGAALTIRS